MNPNGSYAEKLYVASDMELELHLDSKKGKILGFRWKYKTRGSAAWQTRLFLKTGNRICHYFLSATENDDMLCSKLSGRFHSEPGAVPDDSIYRLSEEAAELPGDYLAYIMKYIAIYNKCLVRPD